jgi:hypothetical protein
MCRTGLVIPRACHMERYNRYYSPSSTARVPTHFTRNENRRAQFLTSAKKRAIPSSFSPHCRAALRVAARPGRPRSGETALLDR